jgi:exodeoxyribonuclease VII small subunit
VEAMVGLYRRAEAYAQRCEQLLNQVEQEVRLWSGDDPDSTPTPYTP